MRISIRLISVFFLFILTNSSKAQFVTLPDADFVTWLQGHGFAGCLSGNQMDTTCFAITSSTAVICTTESISDLTGIQYFDNLQNLKCNGNQLTTLPPLPNGLLFLTCSSNDLISLPALPPSLYTIDASSNELYGLPALPLTLTELLVSNNNLLSIPALPPALRKIICDFNQITTLPALPATLEYLQCQFNDIQAIPALPPGLKDLKYGNNLVGNNVPPH